MLRAQVKRAPTLRTVSQLGLQWGGLQAEPSSDQSGPPVSPLRFEQIPEHFCGKELKSGSRPPCIQRQPRLPASLLKKGDPIPVLFDCNLWQEQATPSFEAYDQSMLADLDFLRLCRPQGRQNA